jgi:hypothetical protein
VHAQYFSHFADGKNILEFSSPGPSPFHQITSKYRDSYSAEFPQLVIRMPPESRNDSQLSAVCLKFSAAPMCALTPKTEIAVNSTEIEDKPTVPDRG